MDYSTFQEKKQRFLDNIFPHKRIRRDSVIHVGEDIFSIDGVEVQAEPSFLRSYDEVLNINSKQRKIVRNASGEAGLSNFRNYINVASGMNEAKDVVIVANPSSKTLVSIIPVIDDYIAPSVFFDFAEMLLNDANVDIHSATFNETIGAGFYLVLQNPEKRIVKFNNGEKFLTDGVILSWNPTQICVDHFYERLICQNGLVIKDWTKKSRLTKIDSSLVIGLLSYIRTPEFLNAGKEHFARIIERAARSRVSLSEMRMAQRMLEKGGFDNELIERAIPYSTLRDRYVKAGYDPTGREAMMVGMGTVWDTYNVLTELATHSDAIGTHDIGRTKIMTESIRLIDKEPDIINYIEIPEQ